MSASLPRSFERHAGLAEGCVRLTHLGAIGARGGDAADFLQRQLTSDVTHLPVGQGGAAALCNAKGRVLADFTVLRLASDAFLLVCSADLVQAMLARLVTYRLRSAADLADASARGDVWGAIGAEPSAALRALQTAGRPVPAAMLPSADGSPRTLALLEPGQSPTGAQAIGLADWDFAQVRSGAARLTAPVSGMLTPQMLNLESIGAVDFRKGCYPGQEVVARSQFRGAIKRRAYVGWSAAAARAGQDVFGASDSRQPCGLVVQAAPAPDGGNAVIVSIRIEAVENGGAVTLGAPDGPPVTGLAIPYSIVEI